MAHAAALDAKEHFAAARGGAIDHGLAQRLPVGDERLAVQFGHCGHSLGANLSRQLKRRSFKSQKLPSIATAHFS
jgi:hypothetical protein